MIPTGIPFGYPKIGGVLGRMPDTWQEGVVRSDEPVQGFRAWRAMAVGDAYFLCPLYSDYPPWPHYERMTALCPHWLKLNPSEDHRLGANSIGQHHAKLRSRTVLESYATHHRWLLHPADVEPPFPGCSCGLYHVDHMEQVTTAPSTLYGSTLQGARGLQEGSQASVVGVCRLWGRLIRHQSGWRAQYAYPERLFVIKPDNTPDPVTAVFPTEEGEERRQHLLDWRDRIQSAYGVPVGFCEKKDFKNLGAALED